jgi:hypothetical protein
MSATNSTRHTRDTGTAPLQPAVTPYASVQDAPGERIHRMVADARTPADAYVDQLSVDDIWSRHGPTIVRAKRFVGGADFYPVYRHGDRYSYSLISLILRKGNLRLNRRFARRVAQPGFFYSSGSDTLDREIVRLGGPPSSDFTIRTKEDYAQQLADALRDDAQRIESLHPGHTNVILCGGKDSCNLLLLPWKNPVLVASAPPNYELVKGFVAANGLRFEVVPLDDTDESLLPVETLVNCCRNNLEHCRWGSHLAELSEQLDRNVVFWKGQAGDAVMTTNWKRFHYPAGGVGTTRDPRLAQAFVRYAARRLPRVDRLIHSSGLAQRLVFRSMWSRGAMSLGAHMSLIRQLTNALVLSAYHGPAVRSVLSKVDLHRSVQDDVRPLVGRNLHGRPVTYPATNPGPPRSTHRRGASHLQPFLEALAAAGIPLFR